VSRTASCSGTFISITRKLYLEEHVRQCCRYSQHRFLEST
jgi:hypothetical protein